MEREHGSFFCNHFRNLVCGSSEFEHDTALLRKVTIHQHAGLSALMSTLSSSLFAAWYKTCTTIYKQRYLRRVAEDLFVITQHTEFYSNQFL